MGRVILIFGQPASGKSFSLRTLEPAQTVIIDADKKGALPWRGSKSIYNAANKNFYSFHQLDKILAAVCSMDENKEFQNKTNLVIDGFNNAMMSEVMFYDDITHTKNKFEKYEVVAKKVVSIIDAAQSLREGFNTIFTAHVETADPYSDGDLDKIFTPGKMLKDKIKLESKFIYVFYARTEDGDWYFETTPNKSTARAPYECFPPRIANDLQSAIDTIEKYERTVEGGN